MKLLIIDEDTESGIISAFCEQLRRHGEIPLQISDWRKLDDELRQFRPDGVIVDLMMPHLGLPPEECGAGYTTGAYLYKAHVRQMCPSIPFVVFTAADTKTIRISRAIEKLSAYPEFSGVFEKGEDVAVIIASLAEKARSGFVPVSA